MTTTLELILAFRRNSEAATWAFLIQFLAPVLSGLHTLLLLNRLTVQKQSLPRHIRQRHHARINSIGTTQTTCHHTRRIVLVVILMIHLIIIKRRRSALDPILRAISFAYQVDFDASVECHWLVNSRFHGLAACTTNAAWVLTQLNRLARLKSALKPASLTHQTNSSIILSLLHIVALKRSTTLQPNSLPVFIARPHSKSSIGQLLYFLRIFSIFKTVVHVISMFDYFSNISKYKMVPKFPQIYLFNEKQKVIIYIIYFILKCKSDQY